MTAKLDLAECRDCLCLASRRAARSITRSFDRLLRPHGLRVTQFTMLVMLVLRGPLRIGDLAENLGIERTTLSRNLARIETLGWVRICPGDDGRSRTVSVTAKGRAVLAASVGAWRQAQRSVAAAIGPTGVDALRTLSRSKLR